MSHLDDDRPEQFGHVATYRLDHSAGWLAVSDEWMVPRRYTARMEVAGLPRVVLDVEVSPSGKPICRSVRIESVDEDGLDSAAIRVPLRQLLRTSLAGVAETVQRGADGSMGEAPMTGADVDSFARELRRPLMPPRTADAPRVDDELLSQVAAIYRGAPRSPTKTVGARLGYSRAHAGRLVMEARSRGLLGPARGTTAGEADG